MNTSADNNSWSDDATADDDTSLDDNYSSSDSDLNSEFNFWFKAELTSDFSAWLSVHVAARLVQLRTIYGTVAVRLLQKQDAQFLATKQLTVLVDKLV